MLIRLLLFILLPILANAQSDAGNILILKKGNKNVSKYFKGSPIAFYTREGMPVSGTIDRITTDSIFMYQYYIRRIQRMDGGVVFDTSGRYSLNFSLDNIGSFPIIKQKGRNIFTDGTLLMLGGSGYLFLNIFNTTRQGEPPFGKENLPTVLTASGAIIGGFILKQAWPKRHRVGKKYNLKVLVS